MMLIQLSYDIASSWIKYTEKFLVIPNTTTIINKPFVAWTQDHQHVAEAFNYVECVNFSLQTGSFFLMQCFWNYLSNAITKRSFMGSNEFKFYIFWGVISAAIFPVLQWYFRHNAQLREAFPQFIYSIEVLITGCLGIRSHYRFQRLLKLTRNSKKSPRNVIQKLSYFKDMNILFTIVLFLYGTGLIIVCADGLTEQLVINSSKLASDLMIGNINTCSIFLWLVAISIFHPRRSTETGEAMNDNVVSNSDGCNEKAESKSNADTDASTRYIESNKVPLSIIDYSGANQRESILDNVLTNPMSPVDVNRPVVESASVLGHELITHNYYMSNLNNSYNHQQAGLVAVNMNETLYDSPHFYRNHSYNPSVHTANSPSDVPLTPLNRSINLPPRKLSSDLIYTHPEHTSSFGH
ncbi:hypothetical protein EDC96DRAFT_504199 [Choanephora cucurbitarum]|nr:hypothetical protein EDC96DRAFT_504199 [Choanephora cucurbitarum]